MPSTGGEACAAVPSVEKGHHWCFFNWYCDGKLRCTIGEKGRANYDATRNKVCITVREGAGIPTPEEICPVLRRRLLLTSTVDGPLVNEANSCHSLKRNHYWCPWDAPTIVDRCVVEDTEETQEHKRILTPFSCWRLWACCTAATYSHHVPHTLGKSPQCWEGPVSFSNSLGTMEPVYGRGIEETSGTNGDGVRHCQRRPRGVSMLKHYCPLASWYGVRDLQHLQQVVNPPQPTGRCLHLDRSWEPSTSQGTCGGYPC